MTENFKVGDLVWAKMKGSPPWPGMITKPPKILKRTSQIKAGHYSVFFFATENYAWIHKKNIKKYHNLEAEFAKSRRGALFKKACEKIEEYNLSQTLHGRRLSTKKVPLSTPQDDGLPREFKPRIILARVDGPKPPETNKKKPKRSDNIYSQRVPNINWPAPPEQKLRMFNVDRDSLRQRHILPSNLTFGFIGFETMGVGILMNLLLSGHRVVIWDQFRDKCTVFEEIGAAVALAPCDVAIAADIIFCCLHEIDAVRTTFFGKGGLMYGMNYNKSFVDIAPIDSDDSEFGYIVTALKSVQTKYLKVRIRGNLRKAVYGHLLLLSVGDASVYRNCVSCFKSMCRYHAYYNSLGHLSSLAIQL